MTQTIADRAAFERIRYAQLWEDADVLCSAMGTVEGGTLVSICSAGDNALALLTLDPVKVIAVDLSPAQIECLNLRLGAYKHLSHADFLILMGARPGPRRSLLEKALTDSAPETQSFWQARADQVETLGAGGTGKFEDYFAKFRKFVLPLAHSRATIDAMFTPRDTKGRATYFEDRFDNWRWRLLMRVFFSRFVMGRFGRDKAFFDHVEGSVADHVRNRLRHAAVDTDPSQNPYLHWIMKGTCGTALPLPWRAEAFETIRDRLDRIQPHLGPMEQLAETEIQGFNLSDIFEYMSPDQTEAAYKGLLDMARPGARLVYWNMMAPRRVPPSLAHRVERQKAEEDTLKAKDKAFFYSDFVIEQVR